MPLSSELQVILNRVEAGNHTTEDIATLRRLLSEDSDQIKHLDGKYSINIEQGNNIQIGDSTYVSWNEEAIQALIAIVQSQLPKPAGIPENLPHSGVVEFVGRDMTLMRLHEMLQQNSRSRVSAISGMGGVGKTELALQYALSYRKYYPAGICWLSVRDGNVDIQIVQFGQLFLKIELLKDLEPEDQVSFCWRNWPSGDVLIIFDDVTDYSAIRPLLPPTTDHRFKVLITTRLRLGASVNQIDLEVLDETAAILLLESLVAPNRIQKELDAVKKLCQWLGYLPLALELVGRFMGENPELSIVDIQQRLERKLLEERSLLRIAQEDMTHYSDGLAAAFELSWNELSEQGKWFGCLLSHLFGITPINWSVVKQCCLDFVPEDLEELRNDTLIRWNLLKRKEVGVFQLHELIYRFLSQKSEMHLVEGEKRLGLKNLNVADNLTQLSSNYQSEGLYANAEPIMRRTLLIRQAFLDKDEPLLADTFDDLAVLLLYRQQYEEAEPLCIQSFEIRKQRYGNEHPAVAESMNNLASIYTEQGKLEEAETLFLAALDIGKQALGPEHPDVILNLNNLANCYHWQQKYDVAESLYTEALDRYKKMPEDCPLEIAAGLNNLAFLYYEQERFSEAEPLWVEALDLYRQNVETTHPDIAITLSNLATLYDETERSSEAEAMYLEVLSLREKLFGQVHPKVAVTLNNLAKLYSIQQRYDQAEPFYEKAFSILKETLGSEHPTTCKVLSNLKDLQQAKES